MSHHKGCTGRVRTGDQWLSTLCLCQLGQDIPKFYRDFMVTKACATAANLIDSDGNLHCFMWTLSSYDIEISVVSQGRILVAVQYMNTQLFVFSFSTDILHLLDCSLTWSPLTLTDAD